MGISPTILTFMPTSKRLPLESLTQTHQDNREVTSRVVISKPKLR